MVMLWITILFAAHPWLADMAGEAPPTQPLAQVWAPPPGFTRVVVSEGSYGAWLRTLPVRTDRAQVHSYRGQVLARPSAGVVLMDVGTRDLMQCADTAIRLHAEYLWQAGRADEAAYRFTSGDEARWTDWVTGERMVIAGSSVERKSGPARPEDHASYRSWLDLVFTYAGTRSLHRDAARPAVSSPVQAGDLYVDPGSPGHTVIVLDVAEDGRGGRVGLIGQGFMPAEDLHVLTAPHAIRDVWFELDPMAPLHTPSWRPFAPDQRRRLALRSVP